MNVKVQQFIEDNIELIDSENFSLLYEKAACDILTYVGEMTDLLIDAGIDPLTGMTSVPEFFHTRGTKQQVDLPDHINNLSDKAFMWSGIRTMTLPKQVHAIGVSSFHGAQNLEVVDLSQSEISIIPSRTFCDCLTLKTVILPKYLFRIDRDAFEDTFALREITYDGTLKEFKENCYCAKEWINHPVKIKCKDQSIFYDPDEE